MLKNLENIVSVAIISSFSKKFVDCLDLDVAIVGAGPSGLVAAKTLAEAGFKTAIFERKLAPGGGVWGGGMLFNEVVVQQEAIDILNEFGVSSKPLEEAPGYFSVDSVEMASGLIFGATRAGAKLFNTMSVEDVVFKNDAIAGLVVNWAPVERERLHVDPLVVLSKCVVDGTGHPCEVLNLASRKARVKLDTPTGEILGERPMQAEQGEISTVEYTREYYPGLYACGMCANNVMGGYRMGPIFGGMLRSGKKVAGLIAEALKSAK
ncbi:MAG: thiazole biosynthesis protein [Thermoguttaceae bacterium]|nr:thiazole biosynthesis protein [Thermoguttaceae bacterium]